MAVISDWKKIESFDCALVEKSSADSFGLQILDVCMWLLRRATDNKNRPQGACGVLFRQLVGRSMISMFDFETLVRLVRPGSEYVDQIPLTHERLNRGKKLLHELEQSRQQRMLAAPQ